MRYFGNTPTKRERLIEAVKDQDLVRVDRILMGGLHLIDSEGYVLQVAAAVGNLAIVRMLVEAGADIHRDNNMALHVAVAKNRPSIVEYLIEQGADIHSENDYARRRAEEIGATEILGLLAQAEKAASTRSAVVAPQVAVV